ncbi:MAG: hypothetical protein QXK47_04095 [Candidatus Bathyarchaeia archaeon]
MAEEFIKHRLGNFRMLSEPLDPALVVELNKAIPDFEDRLYNFAVGLRKGIESIDNRIERYIEFIKQEALLRGIKVRVDRACCHRQSCMTCLGQYNTHYPYFRVVESKPTVYAREGLLAFIKRSDNRRYIKRRALKDFLRSINIEEERVKRFIQMCDFRDFLVADYHCQILTFKWAGLSTIELV